MDGESNKKLTKISHMDSIMCCYINWWDITNYAILIL